MRSFMLVLGLLTLAACSKKSTSGCIDPYTNAIVPLGTIVDNAVCTDQIAGGWAVPAVFGAQEGQDAK